jgi:hypothetical protein
MTSEESIVDSSNALHIYGNVYTTELKGRSALSL